MIKKGNLIQYIIIIAIVVIVPLFALSANQNNNSKSFLKGFYCNTLGKWFNDSYCIKVDVIEDSTNPSITLGVNNQTSITNDQLSITNNPSSAKASDSAKATSDKSKDKQTPNTKSTLTTQTTNSATSFEVNNQTPNTADQTQVNTNYETITQLNNNSSFSSSDFVTRDFLSRQVGAIGDSFGRSLSNLSTQLTTLIPSTASISNWDTFFATPSTRITAGAGLSWSGNTLSATGVSGSSFGESMTLSNNVFSVLALSPTTTVPISISSTATSTFAGGLEAWRQIASPYFYATSTTATSTFAGGMRVAGTEGLTVLQNGKVGIGTASPQGKFHIVTNNGGWRIYDTSDTGVVNSESINILAGYSGNSIGVDSGRSVIAGGGGYNMINSIGDTSYLGVISGGYDNQIKNSSYASTISGGGENRILDSVTHGTISGGAYNSLGSTTSALGDYSNIGGGTYNSVESSYSAVVGGSYNLNSGISNNFLGGGTLNIINNSYDVIGGGRENVVSGDYGTITGGRLNLISNNYGVVSGGYINEAGSYSNVGGGGNNVATGTYSTIIGGSNNKVTGTYSTAGGRRSIVSAGGSFGFSDATDSDFTVSTANVFGTRFSGGYWLTGGNVAIGTTSPTSKLQVNNSAITAIPSLGSMTNSSFSLTVSGSYGLMAGVMNTGNTYIQAQRFDGSTTAYNLLIQPNGGKVGIGTTSPYAKFSITNNLSTQPALVVYGFNSQTSPLMLVASTTGSATSTAFIIDNNGNVMCTPFSRHFKNP